MGSAIAPTNVCVSEPAPAAEFFVNGIVGLECHGTHACIVWYRERKVYYGEAEPVPERHVALRLVLPCRALPVIERQLAATIAEHSRCAKLV
jgi:hypothetical protein